MKGEEISLDELKPEENNVRIHPDNQVRELAKSVEQFGQIRPIVVDEDNKIIAGNALYEAFQHLGRSSAVVIRKENLSEADKKKLMLADNKVFNLGMNDNEAIEDTLEELGEEGEFDIPGFDEEMLERVFADDEEVEEMMEEYGKISEEDADDLKSNSSGSKSSGGQSEIVLTNDDIKVDTDENGQTKPFIDCPECGERIWL